MTHSHPLPPPSLQLEKDKHKAHDLLPIPPIMYKFIFKKPSKGRWMIIVILICRSVVECKCSVVVVVVVFPPPLRDIDKAGVAGLDYPSLQ